MAPLTTKQTRSTTRNGKRTAAARKRSKTEDGSVTLTVEEAQLLSEMLDKLIAAAEETVRRLDRLHEAFEDLHAAFRGESRTQRSNRRA
jgi:uncharacterized coiled-coil DUF342 family protein